MVHSGEMAAETADHLVKERQKRAEAEYVPLTEGTETEARQGCTRASSFLETTRRYLLSKGLSSDSVRLLPVVRPYEQVITSNQLLERRRRW